MLTVMKRRSRGNFVIFSTFVRREADSSSRGRRELNTAGCSQFGPPTLVLEVGAFQL